MKIALVGATGNIGTKVLAEALRRGHEVTGIVRNPEKLPMRPGLTAKRGDLGDTVSLSQLLSGHGAVIVSVRFLGVDARALIDAVKAAGVRRLLVVGGAGSLRRADGSEVVDAPDFPEAFKAGSLATRAVLELLKAETVLEWTYLSPSLTIAPGERTGKFRLGYDQLLVDADGQSRISQEDYAVALIDELERPQHVRQRFTVGY